MRPARWRGSLARHAGSARSAGDVTGPRSDRHPGDPITDGDPPTGPRTTGARTATAGAGCAGSDPDTRPLRVPAYRRLFLGQVTTVIGAALTAVAVQQQIYDITGSSAWVGIASLVALVPLVVFGLIGGAIADTYDRRILLMITSVGIALTSIGLWVDRADLDVVGVAGDAAAGRAAELLRGQPADPERDPAADRAGRSGPGGQRAEHDRVQHRGDRRAAAGRRADAGGRAGLAVLHRRDHDGGHPVRGDPAAVRSRRSATGGPGPR